MQIIELTYNHEIIKLYINEKNELFFDDEDIKEIFKLSDTLFEQIIDDNAHKLNDFREYFFDDDEKRLWSKLGIIKLGFFTENEKNLDFIDFIENYKPEIQKKEEKEKESQNNISNEGLVNIYKTLELKFINFSKTITNEDDVNMEELQKFIETFNLFVQTKSDIFPNEKAPLPSTLLNKQNSDKNSLFKSPFNLPSNILEMTHDTSDKAFEFATKLADDAYHFASDGMNYGYMFASQGEELGPMADRVLWMATQIGLMADRIGEMGDRIVHTEHLIINMSVMILNFGLLIDGSIKTIAEVGLTALGIAYDKEGLQNLKTSSQHLELIGKNVELILTQQHEYDLKVLENQKDLRELTITALEHIKPSIY